MSDKDLIKLPYVIIRTINAGVHAGFLKEHKGMEVTLLESRRLWQWKGAMSLSEIAMEGLEYPNECKFAVAVDEIILTQAIEIIRCNTLGQLAIMGVKKWKK